MILQNAEAQRVDKMAKMGNCSAYWAAVWCKLPKLEKFDNSSEKSFQKGLKRALKYDNIKCN